METARRNLEAKKTIREFLQKHSQDIANVPSEDLGIKNKKALTNVVLAYSKNAVKKFRESPEEAVLFEKIPVDTSIPLFLTIGKKSNNKEPNKGKNGIYKIFLTKDEEEVAAFSVRDYGNEFRLSHRYINPKYRRQKIGGMMLQAVEEFVREYAKQDPSREPVMDVYAAQLDVLSFYDSHGYQSVDELPAMGTTESPVKKIYLLDEILEYLESNNSEKFNLGPLKYLFPGDLPEEEHYIQGADPHRPEYENININKAALVHFKKRIEDEGEILPLIPEQINDSTREQLAKNLVGYTFLPEGEITDKTREAVAQALSSEQKIAEYDKDNPNESWSLADIYHGNSEKIKSMSKDWHILGEADESGKIVAIAGYKEHGKMPDGRKIFEISKVSTLKEAQGKKLGTKVMDKTIEYLKQTYPNDMITTASMNPRVIQHFRNSGWEEAPWGDDSNELSLLLSGNEPDEDEPEWRSEWQKMRDNKYISFIYDPLKK
jgi:GNAT superfamily N-acetyltransferase